MGFGASEWFSDCLVAAVGATFCETYQNRK
jgi:hypothetical protein